MAQCHSWRCCNVVPTLHRWTNPRWPNVICWRCANVSYDVGPTLVQHFSASWAVYAQKEFWLTHCDHIDAYMPPAFPINSSPPSDAYMRQWIGSALVQIMACCLFGTKLLFKPMQGSIVNWNIRNKLQWNLNQNTKNFIHENASENTIYEIVAILSRGRLVKAH